MLGGDGMDSSTSVPTARRAWTLVLCHVLSDIKWPHCPRILAIGSLVGYWQPPGVAIGAWARAESVDKEEIRSR
jgi:hypothetical protein